MTRRLIRLPEVLKKWPESRTTVYERIRRGEFPAPKKLGARTVAWDEAEVDAFIESRPLSRPARSKGGATA